MAGTTVNVVRTAQGGLSPISDVAQLCITVNKVVDDLETLRAALSAGGVTLVNALRSHALNQALGNQGFQIRTNFDVQNANAISYLNGGTLKTLSATSAFDTGTAQVIVADKWSAALLSIAANGTGTVTWSATLNAASEAAAIAALPALPAGHTPVGYITVLTGSGVTWTAGTDALQGGTGGTPATTTNYYNSVNPNDAIIGSAASATAVDQAGDLVAAKLAVDGTVITT